MVLYSIVNMKYFETLFSIQLKNNLHVRWLRKFMSLNINRLIALWSKFICDVDCKFMLLTNHFNRNISSEKNLK